MSVPPALVESFVHSRMGAALCDRWPIGTIHRGIFPQLAEWQRKYAPEVKRRTPKKRRRK